LKESNKSCKKWRERGNAGTRERVEVEVEKQREKKTEEKKKERKM
jgi:hypothetical protein